MCVLCFSFKEEGVHAHHSPNFFFCVCVVYFHIWMARCLSSFSRAVKRSVKVAVCRASSFVKGEIKHMQSIRGWTLTAQSQAYCSITGLDPHNKTLPWAKGPPAIRFDLHVKIERGPPTLPPIFAVFLVCCCVYHSWWWLNVQCFSESKHSTVMDFFVLIQLIDTSSKSIRIFLYLNKNWSPL